MRLSRIRSEIEKLGKIWTDFGDINPQLLRFWPFGESSKEDVQKKKKKKEKKKKKKNSNKKLWQNFCL